MLLLPSVLCAKNFSIAVRAPLTVKSPAAYGISGRVVRTRSQHSSTSRRSHHSGNVPRRPFVNLRSYRIPNCFKASKVSGQVSIALLVVI